MAYGNVQAEELIVDHIAIRKDIVDKTTLIQQNIRKALEQPSKQSAISFVCDLWMDSVATRSYLDITFFWVEESGIDRRIWLLKHGM